jgi:hypothetical protein
MRRLFGLVLPALLALAVLAAPAAALADDLADLGDDVLILAEEEAEDMLEEEEEAHLGPDPQPREAEDNPARELGGYDDLDVPFTWGAAFIMLFLGVGGLVLLGGLYWLLVHRPAQNKEA